MCRKTAKQAEQDIYTHQELKNARRSCRAASHTVTMTYALWHIEVNLPKAVNLPMVQKQVSALRAEVLKTNGKDATFPIEKLLGMQVCTRFEEWEQGLWLPGGAKLEAQKAKQQQQREQEEEEAEKEEEEPEQEEQQIPGGAKLEAQKAPAAPERAPESLSARLAKRKRGAT